MTIFDELDLAVTAYIPEKRAHHQRLHEYRPTG